MRCDHILETIKKSEDGKVDLNSINLVEPIDFSSFCYWPSYNIPETRVTIKAFTDQVKRYRLEFKTNLT